MAKASTGRVSAETADRAAAHDCPGCGAPVTLKRGRVVTAHFAHRVEHRCTWAAGETAQHLAAKRSLAQVLAERGLAVELEAEVLSGEGDRRADLLARHPLTGAAVAIEVQHSALSVEAIARRTRAYAAAGVAVIWVATLDPGRIGARPAGRGLRVASRYAAPAWQRWAAAYHGALWFWDDGRLWRGWLGESWVAASGEAASEANGWRAARRWAGLTLEGPFAPGDVRIKLHAHAVEPHESFDLPAGVSAGFVLPGETRAAEPPAEVEWTATATGFAPRWSSRSTRAPAWATPAPAAARVIAA